MKVESITIKNFKLFDNLSVSFKDQTLDEINDRFLILGDNGSGKTTLLQAIALPLALATKQINDISGFDWVGFLPNRYLQNGNPKIELSVTLEDHEIEATHAIAERWWHARPETYRRENKYEPPATSNRLRITLDGDYWQAGESPAQRRQLLGRYYARQLLMRDTNVRESMDALPGVFWFDQYRNLGGSKGDQENGKESRGTLSFQAGVGNLRNYLIKWHQRRDKGQESDYLDALEQLYKTLFPKRRFQAVGTSPRLDNPLEEEANFLLHNGKESYELVEMSAGEQSIFPILYEIVRLRIANSVVLIDELDLNLHPPLAQFLATKLLSLAPTCQFIVTTHSEAVNNVFGESETFRLSGGALCL